MKKPIDSYVSYISHNHQYWLHLRRLDDDLRRQSARHYKLLRHEVYEGYEAQNSIIRRNSVIDSTDFMQMMSDLRSTFCQ